MARKKKANVPDIVIGIFLMVAIPAVTLLSLSSSSRPDETAAAAGTPADAKALPLTAEELNDLKTEYIRMYRENARLFLQRSVDSKIRDREQSWARQVLIRCQKGLTDLKIRVKASNRFADSLPEIERCLVEIDTELKALPPAPPGAAPATRTTSSCRKSCSSRHRSIA